MKKLVYIFIICFAVLGCNKKKNSSYTKSEVHIEMSSKKYKFGDTKVVSNGDTLYYIPYNKEAWVSSEEWHEYFEKFKEEIDSIDKGLK